MSSGSSSWLRRGADEIGKAMSAQGGGNLFRPDRFYLKYSSAKEVAWVDQEGAQVFEHCPYYDGTRKDHAFTCQDMGGVCCDEFGTSFKDRYPIVYYTVVDCSEWVDSKGVSHRYGVKLLGAKFGPYEKLAVRAREDGLAGKLLKVRRYSAQMEPSVGSEFAVVRDISLPDLFKVAKYKGKLLSTFYDEADADPAQLEVLGKIFSLEFDAQGKLVRTMPAFNYDSVLAGPSDLELQRIIHAARKGAKDVASTSAAPSDKEAFAGTEDDVPF